jgi:hypothetical protein
MMAWMGRMRFLETRIYLVDGLSESPIRSKPQIAALLPNGTQKYKDQTSGQSESAAWAEEIHNFPVTLKLIALTRSRVTVPAAAARGLRLASGRGRCPVNIFGKYSKILKHNDSVISDHKTRL